MIEQLDDKDPSSEEVFNWDFEPMLADGDTIATVSSIAFDETDGALAVIGAPAVSSDGLRVSAKLGACTKGQYYTVRCRVITTPLGETLDLSLRFYCDDT